MRKIWFGNLILSLSFLIAAPSGSWYLDELGDASSDYLLEDQVAGNEEGEAHRTDSTGNSGGQICSALDFTLDSIDDCAVLDEDSIDGADDFTISLWLKSNSTKDNQSLLSGARSGQANALLLWFDSATLVQPHIDNRKVNFSTQNLYDWAGGTVSSPTKECGYFEVDIL